MTEAQSNSLNYYARKGRKQIDDYDALDQGQYMTDIRHRWVCNQLHESKRVLDYGCGTGLILTRDDFPANQLESYVGADFMEDRRELFTRRLTEANLLGGFLHLMPNHNTWLYKLVRMAILNKADTVVLCGLMGYEGFLDLESVFEQITNINCKPVITVPVKTDFYDETEITRFDPGLVKTLGGMELAPGLYGLTC